MKFTCTQPNLAKALSQVAPVAGRNKQVPVLSQILLRMSQGILTLTTTDLDISITVTVGGKAEGETAGTVQARQLADYVQQLPPGNPVELSFVESNLEVSTKGFSGQIALGQDDDFPTLPSVSGEGGYSLPTSSLCRALTTTSFAAAKEATRPELHSVYMKSDGDNIFVVATDSFRLSEDVIEVKDGVDFDFLLPLVAAQDIVRLFSDEEYSQVNVSPQEGYVSFRAGGLDVSSRLIDGQYPDYKHIIPKSSSSEGLVEKNDLVRALKTLLVFLPADSRRVRLESDPQEGFLRLSVEGGGAAGGSAEVDLEGTGETVEAMFNIQYLLEGLSHIASKQVSVRLGGASEPAVLTPPQGSSSHTYVVMPIQA